VPAALQPFHHIHAHFAEANQSHMHKRFLQ